MGECCAGEGKYSLLKMESQAPITPRFHLTHPPAAHSPALAGRWGRPGDTLFLCSAGCWGDRSRGSVRDDVTREGVTRELLGLLNCSEL